MANKLFFWGLALIWSVQAGAVYTIDDFQEGDRVSTPGAEEGEVMEIFETGIISVRLTRSNQVGAYRAAQLRKLKKRVNGCARSLIADNDELPKSGENGKLADQPPPEMPPAATNGHAIPLSRRSRSTQNGKAVNGLHPPTNGSVHPEKNGQAAHPDDGQVLQE